MKTYGPYYRKDGRAHVIHVDGETRRTQSYPRFLMEQFLNRALENWEHVDHINEDRTDNRIENLQILDQKSNNQKSFLGREVIACICPTCKKSFNAYASRVRYNQEKRKGRGPYCSKSCANRDR